MFRKILLTFLLSLLLFSFRGSAQAPIADFSANITDFCIPSSVDFFDNSTGGTATSWQWSFGPGAFPATSSMQFPTGITYSLPGSYNVQLTVTNASGTDTKTKIRYIVAKDCRPPQAGFISNTSVCETNCLNFQDTSKISPTNWQWFFPGGTPDTSSKKNPSICYNVAGTYDVILIASNAYGFDTVVKTGWIRVDTCPRPIPDFSASSTTICHGTCVNFTDLSLNVDSTTKWQWFFPGATPDTSTLQNPDSICYDADGLYDVILIARNQFGVDTIPKIGYIDVNSVPGSFVGTDTMAYFGVPVTLFAVGGTSYLWLPGGSTEDTIIVKPAETTTYTCIITDSVANCSTVKTVIVVILHKNKFFVPNTFSPVSADGFNYLFVRGNNFTEMHFSIYDRWGEKIFTSTNQADGWDGNYKGIPCNTGVYVYTLTVKFSDGEKRTENGNVTLIR